MQSIEIIHYTTHCCDLHIDMTYICVSVADHHSGCGTVMEAGAKQWAEAEGEAKRTTGAEVQREAAETASAACFKET